MERKVSRDNHLVQVGEDQELEDSLVSQELEEVKVLNSLSVQVVDHLASLLLQLKTSLLQSLATWAQEVALLSLPWEICRE